MTGRKPNTWMDVVAVFEKHIHPEPNTGCWLWGGYVNKKGYGLFMIHLNYIWKNMKAHRMAYALYVGELKPGLTIDHLCRTRCCVNPKHLEQVTLRENQSRGIYPKRKPLKEFCYRGHKIARPIGRCHECAKIHRLKYRQKEAS